MRAVHERDEELEEEIVDWMVGTLSEVLELEAEEIDLQRPFSHYGLGSAEAVMILGDLESWLGCTLPAQLAFDFPTIEALATHLGAERQRYQNLSPE